MNTIADQGDIHLDKPTIKQSKSSMNKTVGKKPLSLNHPNLGKVRQQPISIWDQIQVHDSQLYQQEMEDKRLAKRQEQAQMREFLQNQMLGNK